jgi:DNA-binding FadR family transcriptional regulator
MTAASFVNHALPSYGKAGFSPTTVAYAERREILAACKAHDPQRAADAVEQHFAYSARHRPAPA